MTDVFKVFKLEGIDFGSKEERYRRSVPISISAYRGKITAHYHFKKTRTTAFYASHVERCGGWNAAMKNPGRISVRLSSSWCFTELCGLLTRSAGFCFSTFIYNKDKKGTEIWDQHQFEAKFTVLLLWPIHKQVFVFVNTWIIKSTLFV